MRTCSKIKHLRDVPGCTMQIVEVEKSERGASAIEKHEELTQQQVALRALDRELLALVSSSRSNKCMEFAYQDFNAAINISRCAVQKARPAALTRANVMGQPLRVEVQKETLRPTARGWSIKAARRLRVNINLLRVCERGFRFAEPTLFSYFRWMEGNHFVFGPVCSTTWL